MFSVVPILDVEKAACSESASLTKRHIEKGCYIVRCSALLFSLKELEQRNILFLYGTLQMKSI